MVLFSQASLTDSQTIDFGQNPQKLVNLIVKLNEFQMNKIPFYQEAYKNQACDYTEAKARLEKAAWFSEVKDNWTPKQIEETIQQDMLRAKYQFKNGKFIVNSAYKTHIEQEVASFTKCVTDFQKRKSDSKGVSHICQVNRHLLAIPTYDWRLYNQREEKGISSGGFYQQEYHEKDLQAFKGMINKAIPEFQPIKIELAYEY